VARHNGWDTVVYEIISHVVTVVIVVMF